MGNKKQESDIFDIENLNKEQLELTLHYNNSFALMTIASALSFFIASNSIQDNLLAKSLFLISALSLGFIGFGIMKGPVRRCYIRLMKLNSSK